MQRSLAFLEAMAAHHAGNGASALRLMEQCAQQGDAVACFTAALWHRRGQCAAADSTRCTYWMDRLEQLARSGDALAQYEFSTKLRWGVLVAKDTQQANRWLEQAAESGHADAQHQLGWYHEVGQYGYPIDATVAESWYERSFQQGNPETLYLFATRRLDEGATSVALELLSRAAAQGFSQAELLLRSLTP